MKNMVLTYWLTCGKCNLNCVSHHGFESETVVGQCFKGNNIPTLCVVHINNYIAKTAGDWFVYSYRYCIVVLYADAIQLNFPSSVVLYSSV